MKFFDLWNRLKQLLHNEKQSPFFRNRDVWFCSFGENIGFEQDGKGEEFLRPVLIVRKFNNDLFLGVALTSQKKEGKYYYKISDIGGRKNWLILSQIRTFSAYRLRYQIGRLSLDEFNSIEKVLKNTLFPEKKDTFKPPKESRGGGL